MTETATKEIPFHPLANLFPLIEGMEFDELVEDIRVNGLREPVLLHQEQILDGRNRYRALKEIVEKGLKLGKFWGGDLEGKYLPPDSLDLQGGWHGEPFELYEDFDENDDPLAYVISKNLRRRHLSGSQRAMVAAKLATMRQGERTDLEPSANLQKVDQNTAADLLSVSTRSVASAKAVQEHGTPELQHAVEQGLASVSAAEAISTLPAEQQTEIVARGEKEIKKAAKEINARDREKRRNERFEDIRKLAAKNQPLPTDYKFPVIYADPPWRFEAGFSDRSVENHYPTMTVDEICALPVKELATPDAILFMWVTAPHFLNAARVLEAWGFEYASQHVWDKEFQGTGHWFYIQHEILIVATRGKFPAPAPHVKARSIYREKRTPKHSEKPKYYYDMIERMTPDLPRIELFSRGGCEGWVAWGNQANPEEYTSPSNRDVSAGDSHGGVDVPQNSDPVALEAASAGHDGQSERDAEQADEAAAVEGHGDSASRSLESDGAVLAHEPKPSFLSRWTNVISKPFAKSLDDDPFDIGNIPSFLDRRKKPETEQKELTTTGDA